MELRRPTRSMRALVAIGALGLVATLAAACQLPGATYVVTTTADQPDAAPGDGVCATAGGACSLRAAITEANAGPGLANVELGDGATYVLSIPGPGEDAAATGDLDVVQTVAINGRATIDGGGLDRVLDVRSGTLFLDGTTITGGDLGPSERDAANRRGGGIRVATGAQLVGAGVTIEGNHAWHGGGGIAAAGKVVLHDSTVIDNRTTGGQLSFEGAFLPAHGAGVAMAAGDLTLTDSAVVGNQILSTGDGSAIHGSGAATVTLVRSAAAGNRTGAAVTAPTLTLTNSTISGNIGPAALAGGNISITASTIVQSGGFAVNGPGTVTVNGSILSTTASPVCSMPITSLGYTIATDASCGLAGPSDRPSTDPFLGPLGVHGGGGPTHLPFAGSVALDAIPAGTSTVCDGSNPTDQRGEVRPAGAACDIGAVEGSTTTTSDPLALVVDDPGPARDVHPGDGLCTTTGGGCTLPAAVDETNAWPPADTITIATGTNPVIGLQDLLVVDDLVLHGNGATISGGGDDVLEVDGPTVTVDRATLSGPSAVRAVRGTLTLVEVTVDGSFVRIEPSADVSIVRSTINGQVSGSGRTTIVSSTINSNGGYAIMSYGPGGATSGIDVRSSTIVGSSVDNFGLWPAVAQQGAGVPIRIRGSVIVGAGGACDSVFRPASLGYNVLSDATCGFAATGDDENASPLLLGPAANGGPTATRLLYANSPAVNAIPAGTAGLCDASVPTDQRGLPRRVGPACDAGATEGPAPVSPTAPLALVVDRSADGGDEHPGDGTCLAPAAGGCTLRAAIDEANAWPFPDAITFAAGVAPVLSLAGSDDLNRTGDLDINGPLTITGNATVIDGGHVDGVLDHHTGALALRTLHIRGGGGLFAAGGIRSTAPLDLRSVIVAANAGTGIATSGPLTISASSIVDNGGDGINSIGTTKLDRVTVARSGNSGIVAQGPFTMTRSTVSDNGYTALSIYGLAPVPATITASTIVGGPTTEYTIFNDFERPTTIIATAITTENTDPGAHLCANPIAAASYTRTTDTTCAAPGTGNAVVASLGLGPLAANGGSTATRLPGLTSALLDVVPLGMGSCTPALPLDQRSLPRPSGAACDVGAVERQP